MGGSGSRLQHDKCCECPVDLGLATSVDMVACIVLHILHQTCKEIDRLDLTRPLDASTGFGLSWCPVEERKYLRNLIGGSWSNKLDGELFWIDSI